MQKDVIKNMVKEMLNSGVIKDNNNLYTSPMVLVNKKVGTCQYVLTTEL